jgi:hypothetical protein
VSPPDLAGGARLAAIRLAVAEQDALLSALFAGKVAHATHMGQVVVASQTAMGATLVFAPAAG